MKVPLIAGTPANKIGLLICSILLGIVLALVLNTIITIPIFGLDMAISGGEIVNYGNDEVVNYLKVTQFIISIGAFIFPALLYSYLFTGSVAGNLTIKRFPNGGNVILSILVVLMSLPAINFLVEFNSSLSLPSYLGEVELWMRNMEDKAERLTEAFLRGDTIMMLIINIGLVAVLPAIGEEFLFRGTLQKMLYEFTKNHHVAIILTGLLFSAIHMQFFGFIPRFLLGVMFGYLFVWSKSIWVPVLAHFVNNAGAVIVKYLENNNVIGAELETVGTTEDSLYLAVVSLLLVTVLLLILRKRKREL